MKETLEEATERLYPTNIIVDYDTNEEIRNIWLAGAKWQADRMYSEEEILKILESHKDILEFDGKNFNHDDWFEQFKKK
jgi:hypothetical protein